MRTRVLFVEGNTDGTVGGSYYILLDLLRNIDRARFEPIALFTHENIVAEQARAAGVRVIIAPPATPFMFRQPWLNRALAPVKRGRNFVRGYAGAVAAQTRLLRDERIDLVNLNNSITVNHTWMLAAWRAGIPCLTHEMGINEHYSLASRVLGKRLDAVLCLSNAILEALEKGGARFPNTEVIYSIFDPKRYRHVDAPETLRARHGIPAGAPVIGVVGNIKEWKGQETIIRATHRLRAAHPELRCVLAGGNAPRDRPYLDRLHAVCAELGVADRVVFAGFQANPIDYMRLMDVVVHTSTSPEPFGIVLLEAMLLGKPLVSTTIGGPAEVVVDGRTGLLVEPGKPDALAEAVDRLLRDPRMAAEMGARGRERLDTDFGLDTTMAQTMRVYDRIMAARGRR